MDILKLVQLLTKGVDVLEELTPLATAIGGPIVGNIVKTVGAFSEIGQNVLDRANEAKAVFSETDQDAIAQVIARLAAVNDKLAETIAAS
jgi:outer membrane lipopolysaccharide assembly protein LptE/RlpB